MNVLVDTNVVVSAVIHDGNLNGCCCPLKLLCTRSQFYRIYMIIRINM